MKLKPLTPRQANALQMTLDGHRRDYICEKLGITHKTLWNWRKLIVDGKLKDARKDCQITMLDYEGTPVVTYSLVNAWPKKYTGVGLKADSNEVAVEGVTLCHEGMEIA